jgi:hypothetical protein
LVGWVINALRIESIERKRAGGLPR